MSAFRPALEPNARRNKFSGCFDLETTEKVYKYVNSIVIATGHGNIDGKNYPMPDCYNHVCEKEEVLVSGLGLVSMDAICALTVGRGGRFQNSQGGLIYLPSNNLPSNNEPKITVTSRTGLPYKARPFMSGKNRKKEPFILTEDYVLLLKKQYPNGINFNAQILPILRIEMLLQYIKSSKTGEKRLRKYIDLFSLNYDGTTESMQTAHNKIFEDALPNESSNIDMLLVDNAPNFYCNKLYEKWLIENINSDIDASQIPIENSPIKAAAEIWGDFRDILRLIINYSGLSYESHNDFYKKINPLVNRLVTGPQKERLIEFVALYKAGVVHIRMPKNKPQSIDGIKKIDAFMPKERSSKLLDELYKKQLIDFNSLGNICIDANNEVISTITSKSNIFAIGPVVEGSTYYNHYIPTNAKPSRAFIEASNIALTLINN